MKNIHTLFFALLAITLSTVSIADEKKESPGGEPPKKSADEKCQAPKWAIAIGHEEKWKLHNGCGDKKKEK
jgi:hypothetical protein